MRNLTFPSIGIDQYENIDSNNGNHVCHNAGTPFWRLAINRNI